MVNLQKRVPSMKNKRYPLEFKIEAIKRLNNRGDRSVADVAEALGVAESQLYMWRKRHSKKAAEQSNSGET